MHCTVAPAAGGAGRGALARMYHLAMSGADPSSATLYEGFERAYSKHAYVEARLLQNSTGSST